MARVTRSNDDGLADLITCEVGEPLQAARGELEFAAPYADSMAGWDRRREARPPRRATPTATLPRAPASRCGCGVSSILPITDSSALVSGAEPPIWSSSPLLRRVDASSGPPV
jgi:acyl-CoA reductase-like NAD-dependent aldehyde dehydrogenase